MRWYVNDISLQGQYVDIQSFEVLVREIIRLRARIENLRIGFFTTRTFRERFVSPTLMVREVIQDSRDADFRRVVMGWLDRYGPFTEDDRLAETDDYFEYSGIDVTDTGLGEAARRTKVREPVAAFSFIGGEMPFDMTPLLVDHGLDGDRLGRYEVENLWTLDQLATYAIDCEAPVTSWKGLVESARQRFPWLLIPDSVYQRLAREPFNAAIRDRTFALLGHLNLYMSDRLPSGGEGEAARSVIDNFFTGERALFTGESVSNQHDFAQELTFPDPSAANRTIFAHWHGKISYRVFRMHFEWPVPSGSRRLKVLYLGPKLTKQ